MSPVRSSPIQSYPLRSETRTEPYHIYISPKEKTKLRMCFGSTNISYMAREKRNERHRSTAGMTVNQPLVLK